jgi:hypothetical protein
MASRRKVRSLTQSHFRLFTAEFKRLMALLGMTDWRVDFKFEHMARYAGDRDTIIHGMCDADTEARSATIILGREVCTANELEAEVLDTARHECLELLLSDITDAAGSRKWDPETFDGIKHTVIARFCNMLEKIDEKSAK